MQNIGNTGGGAPRGGGWPGDHLQESAAGAGVLEEHEAREHCLTGVKQCS